MIPGARSRYADGAWGRFLRIGLLLVGEDANGAAAASLTTMSGISVRIFGDSATVSDFNAPAGSTTGSEPAGACDGDPIVPRLT